MPIRTSEPILDIERKNLFVYGSPKWGKSSFFAAMPNTVFIATEAGLNSIPATRWESNDKLPDGTFRYVVKSWAELEEATREVIHAGAKRICIDTIDNAYYLAERAVCAEYGANHTKEGKLSWGVGETIVNNRVREYLLRIGLSNVSYGITSHTRTEKRDDANGEYTVTLPSVSDKIRPVLSGMVDAILYFGTDAVTVESPGEGRKKQEFRAIFTRNGKHYEAGGRMGKLPPVIHIPNDIENPGISYTTFLNAYKVAYTAEANTTKEKK